MSVSFFLFFNAFAFLKRLQILETFTITFPLKYRGKRTGTKRKPSYICRKKKKKQGKKAAAKSNFISSEHPSSATQWGKLSLSFFFTMLLHRRKKLKRKTMIS